MPHHDRSGERQCDSYTDLIFLRAITITYARALKKVITTDKNHFRHVLLNLASNILFTTYRSRHFSIL